MEFLKSANARKSASIALVVVSVLVLGYVIARHTVLAEPSLEKLSRQRAMIDSKTLKAYPSANVPDGSSYPWKNPDTGENTLYPAEFCFWTKDGKAKLEPTYVLLNELVGKPGKTACPECGRTVVAHNPMPPQDLLVEAARLAGKLQEEPK